ncbi:MAG: DNA polymerase III subunit delta, partial [Alphaproteobacteria bacterium]
QIRGWGLAGLERALRILMQTDLTLRSGSAAPPEALVSRALIGIARLRQGAG